MLTIDDITEYIKMEQNRININILLLYNDIGFFILPLKKPCFAYDGKKIIFKANGYNILENEYFNMEFSAISHEIMKWISNPQHLYACDIGFGNQRVLEVTFSRSDEGRNNLWLNVVSDFLECASFQTLDELERAINKAKRRFSKLLRFPKNKNKIFDLEAICEHDLLWKSPIIQETNMLDDIVFRRAIKQKYDESISSFFNNYQYGVLDYKTCIKNDPFYK